jgi:hypothetical protein
MVQEYYKILVGGGVGGLKASDFGTQIPLCGDQTKLGTRTMT